MRVITGSARGVRLGELEGMETRPTTDRVKESMFNIIQFELEGRRVLDLFGGTGQLGIEALSRGAADAVFVDARDDAALLIAANLKKAKLNDRGRVVRGDSIGYLSSCREKFGVIFLDPPYQSGLLAKAIAAISEFDILTDSGIMLCERPAEGEMPEIPAGFTARDYRYGKTVVTLLRQEA